MCNQGGLHKASFSVPCYRTCCAAAVKFVARKKSKKKDKKRNKRRKKKEKEAQRGNTFPRRAQKIDFYTRIVKRNRNEIETRKNQILSQLPTKNEKHERK